MYQETKRLILCPFTLADAPALHEILSDPEVMRHIEPPFDEIRTRAFLEQAALCAPPRVFALREKTTDALVGHVIFHPFEEDAWELGWVLGRIFWGRGYASEATAALLDYACRAGIPRLVIEFLPAQSASRRLAQKFGFVPAGEFDGLERWEKRIEKRACL